MVTLRDTGPVQIDGRYVVNPDPLTTITEALARRVVLGDEPKKGGGETSDPLTTITREGACG